MIDYTQITECVAAGVFRGGIHLVALYSLIRLSVKLITKAIALYKLKKFQKNIMKTYSGTVCSGGDQLAKYENKKRKEGIDL